VAECIETKIKMDPPDEPRDDGFGLALQQRDGVGLAFSRSGGGALKVWNEEAIRADFPILRQEFHGKRLVYLDSGVTSQKPLAVINALKHYYESDNANVHRGVYALSERATKLYQEARRSIQHFIGAKHYHEIIFTRGTTEAINLVAHGFSQKFLKPGDDVLISAMEHHSNIVPWQMACAHSGATLRVIPLLENGDIDLKAYQELLSEKTKLVALIQVSNVMGTLNPIREMTQLAHQYGAAVLVDGAQSVPHLAVNMQELDCDFFAFSSHKCYGPMGVGVLYGKETWLEKLPVYQTGGDMISRVTYESAEFNVLPYRFEAGTPNVAGVIGLKVAIDYISNIGFKNIAEHEAELLQYAKKALKMIPGLKLIGEPKNQCAVISFVLDGIHPHDIATILDSEGIAIRAGHHCAMPLMDRLGLVATSRISLGIYNTQKDIDVLIHGLQKVLKLFKRPS
jgi:cysteine desulfurase/selenocysteine lyase